MTTSNRLVILPFTTYLNHKHKKTFFNHSTSSEWEHNVPSMASAARVGVYAEKFLFMRVCLSVGDGERTVIDISQIVECCIGEPLLVYS